LRRPVDLNGHSSNIAEKSCLYQLSPVHTRDYSRQFAGNGDNLSPNSATVAVECADRNEKVTEKSQSSSPNNVL